MRTNLKVLRKRNHKQASRVKRKFGIRKKIGGTADRPRLSVFRSAKHIYAQVIDDASGVTLASASTMDKEVKGEVNGEQKKTEVAKVVGEALAKRCTAKGIKSVVFDRNGFRFHGRVAAVAAGAREGGLEF
jgi:large subunit ribosomal protein L18